MNCETSLLQSSLQFITSLDRDQLKLVWNHLRLVSSSSTPFLLSEQPIDNPYLSVKKWLRYHHISVECWYNNHLRLCWPYLIHFLTILDDLWCILELYSRAINILNVCSSKLVWTNFLQFLKFCQKIQTGTVTNSNLWWTGTAVQFFCSLL